MKHATLVTALFVLALTACDKKPAEPFIPDPVIPPSGALPPGHPPVNANAPSASPTDAPETIQTQKATVVSAINIPQFTYIEISQGNQTRWLATSTVEVKKGDVIKFDNGSIMTNFNSKALNRTFPSIAFVNHVTVTVGK